MRILILSPSSYPEPGGLQRYTYNLAQSLAAHGLEVGLLTLQPVPQTAGKKEAITYLSPPRWNRVEGGLLSRLWQKLYLAWFIHRLLSRFRPDQAICTWWDPLGYLALLPLWLRRLPWLCVAHGQEVILLPENPLFRWLKALLRRLVFRAASRVIAVSAFTAGHVRALGLSPSHLKVVPNGLSPAYLAEAAAFSRQESRRALQIEGHAVLQVGRLVPRKGHALVLAALPEVERALGEPVNYLVVGGGPERDELQALAGKTALRGELRFAGYLPDERLHQYYAAADLLVMPSHNPRRPGDAEGFGIAFLEAYAHGLPVIGADTGGIPDAVLDGETGLLVPPGDKEALAGAILRLLRDPAEAARMAARGRALLTERWNWDTLWEHFLLIDPSAAMRAQS